MPAGSVRRISAVVSSNFCACFRTLRSSRCRWVGLMFSALLGMGLVANAGAQTAHFGFAPVAVGNNFLYPAGVAVDRSGNVFVVAEMNLSESAQLIYEIPAGCITASCITTVGGGTNAGVPADGVSEPIGVAVDGSGNVFVTEQISGDVKEIPPGCVSSSCVKTLATGFGQPYGIAVDGNDNVFVTDTDSGMVKEIPSGCTTSGCINPLASGFDSPFGVAVDGSGNVYVGEYLGGDVKEILAVGGSIPASPTSER